MNSVMICGILMFILFGSYNQLPSMQTWILGAFGGLVKMLFELHFK
jgi:hypothetical protein